ncbi:cytochrome P450 4c3-like [Brevipalpus obovatus]|uniref:cytochrome P450 4c3-like n=1 Tax=Brevipalpus obovatus TaxID=246614 RepID=UPI003D9E5B2A
MSWKKIEDSDGVQQYRHRASALLFVQGALRILSSTWFRTVLIVTGLIFVLLRKYTKWRRIVNLIEKIPGPPSHWLLGHANLVLDLDKIGFPYGTYVLIYQMLASTPLIYGKERICRMWLGLRPFVLLFTPESVETILTSTVLTDKANEYDFLKPWLGEGLVTSNRNKWKMRRKILTPAFHFRILNDFLPIINEHANVLVEKLKMIIEESQSSPIDIVQPMTLCTLDVICDTAMGIKVHGQEKESEYVNCLHQVSELILERLTRPWLWPNFIFAYSKRGRKFKRCLKVMKDFTMSVIKERKKEWISRQKQKSAKNSGKDSERDSDIFCPDRKRMAFLDLLLEHHLDNNHLTLEDVREEVDTFMFAGHDTTAMAISWTLYMLGLHMDVQERVRKEIDEILDTDSDQIDLKFTAEQLKEMRYLDCVLKEIQRIYPTAPFIGRELCEDTMIDGYLVPKGTTCAIFTYLVHRNEEIFPKPEVFDPDRFLPENTNGRHPFAYIPFSAGPRNCIGQKFAIMEQKAVVANVIRNFYLTTVEERDKLIISGEMILRSRNGLFVKLKKRFDQ